MTPAADIERSASAIYVTLDVPGCKADGITLHHEGQRLTIHGKTTASAPAAGQTVHHEFTPSHYQRSFTLPDNVDASAIAANLQHGVLTVTIPLRTANPARQIPVTTGG